MAGKLKKTILTIVLLFSITGAAEAASLTYDFNKALTLTNWSQIFNLSQFDPSQGTLLSVAIDLGSTVDSVITATNNGSSAGTIKIQTDVVLTASGPVSGDLLDVITSPRWQQTLNPGQTASSPQQDIIDSNITTYTDAGTLANFIGLGTVGLTLGTSISYYGTTPSNFVVSDTTHASLTGHLTYTYDAAAPVPEPATMLLFGAGLVGFAGLNRRRFWKK